MNKFDKKKQVNACLPHTFMYVYLTSLSRLFTLILLVYLTPNTSKISHPACLLVAYDHISHLLLVYLTPNASKITPHTTSLFTSHLMLQRSHLTPPACLAHTQCFKDHTSRILLVYLTPNTLKITLHTSCLFTSHLML